MKSFIKDQLLSFETLIFNYFDGNSNRFNDSVIPTNETFGEDKVLNKILPIILKYWNTVKENEKEAFLLLELFGIFFPSYSMEFLLELIGKMPIVEDYNLEYLQPNERLFFHEDPIIKIIDNLCSLQSDLSEYIELFFEYVKKKPDSCSQVIDTLGKIISLEQEDLDNNYIRQVSVFEFIIENLNSAEPFFVLTFYELSRRLLGISYVSNKRVIELRGLVLKTLLLNFNKFPKESLDILNSYNTPSSQSKKNLHTELPLLIEIVNSCLDPKLFSHCLFVNDFFWVCKYHSLEDELLLNLKEKFNNQTLSFYQKISPHYLNGKPIYLKKIPSNFESLKEQEVKSFFVFKSKNEILKFY